MNRRDFLNRAALVGSAKFVGWDQQACERRPTKLSDWWAGARKLAGPTLFFLCQMSFF